MARKTTGSFTPRKRKTAAIESAPLRPATLQAASNVVAKKSDVNLDEEIRRRAYELYLQRNGAAGDPNRDWFIAEREILSRYAGPDQHSA
jgi:hypothetical protein